MSNNYATDAEFLIYVPAAAVVSASLRELALTDAEEFIDPESYRGKTTRAHAMLAAHFLAMDEYIAGGGGGMVTARSANGIAASYATSARTPEDSLLATTKYGRSYLMIRDQVIHSPEAV